MRRSLVVASAVAALVGVTAPATQARSLVGDLLPGSDPAPPSQDWNGDATMLGGTSQVSHGELVHTDFVYDDYGADVAPAGSTNIVTLAGTAGDARYPAGLTNAADIVELRVRRFGDHLKVRIIMESLYDAATTGIGLAFDTQPDVAGEHADWPAAAGIHSDWDRFFTIAEGEVRGQWTDADGSHVMTVGSASVDTETNVVEAVIPHLGTLPSVRLVAGAGLWDAAADEFLLGTPKAAVPGTYDTGAAPTLNRILDLAFNDRTLEPRGGNWMEDAQSDALFLGNVDEFDLEIDVASLTPDASEPYVITPGYYNGIFESRMTHMGEGLGSSFPQYKGRYQPYGLWIPADYDASEETPLLVVLHSLSVHHNQYAGAGVESYRTFYEQIGDGLSAIAVTPLGRGPDGWYENEGLVDTLEALADVDARLDIDHDRTYLTGYSMGGHGTYRLGTLLAERWAGAVSWAGVPTDGARLNNMEWVPTQIVHGTADELVPITGVRAQADRFEALGYEYRMFEHPGVDHLMFVYLDDWTRDRDWLSTRQRVVDPPHVSFSIRPDAWLTGRGGGVPTGERRAQIEGALHDLADLRGSYWVRDVYVTDGDQTGTVDVESLALAYGPTITRQFRDEPHAGPPTPYLARGLDRELQGSPSANGLDITLTDVGGSLLELDRAGIDTSDDIALAVDTADETFLRLRGDFVDGTQVLGSTLGVDVIDGTLTIHLAPGEHTLTVVPA